MIKSLNRIDYATQRINIPTCTTAIFRLYDDRVPLNFSPALPYIQLNIERSSQVTTRCVQLSDFGILGLRNDVAVMTDCQCVGRTMYMLGIKLMVIL